MREAKKDDFVVDVEGAGRFVFGRRTVRDRFRIAAEYHRLTEGTAPAGTDFALVAEAQATLSTMLVEAPESFSRLLDLDEADPLDSEVDAKVVNVFLALRAKELSFRPGASTAGKKKGQGDGDLARVLVSEEVRASAD
jgi:hypothetical protein